MSKNKLRTAVETDLLILRHVTFRYLTRDRSFAVAGPQLWNSLPVDLRLVDKLALGDS